MSTGHSGACADDRCVRIPLCSIPFGKYRQHVGPKDVKVWRLTSVADDAQRLVAPPSDGEPLRAEEAWEQ
eukprot:5808173-Prymnesium_polylepis.2